MSKIKIHGWPYAFAYLTEDGRYVLADRDSILMPDSEVEKVIKLGISDEEYHQNQKERQDYANEQFAKKSKEQPQRPGFIYAVHCGEKIKLGRTFRLEQRFRAYKNLSHNFRVIATTAVLNDKKSEREMLEKFGWKLGDSEWFPYSKKLEKQVSQHITELAVMT